MSSYVKKTIVCPCCGNNHTFSMLKGYSPCSDVDLDTNPHNPALYDRVIMCPNCGYSTSKPYSSISDGIKSVVKSSVYTDMLNNKMFDNISKKLILAGYLAVKERDAKEAGYDYLLAYWYLKETNSSEANRACEKAIKNFERYLNKSQDEEIALIIIDCYRQMKRFNDAMETIESLEQFVGDSKVKQILLFEKSLVESGDYESHRLSEVGL
jgi:uncharacterized protein (DUF2225 family)